MEIKRKVMEKMMEDTALINARKKLESSPNLTDKEYKKIMSHMNDEDSIDNLNFDKKDYDILDYVVFD
jgi:hypothetical protein